MKKFLLLLFLFPLCLCSQSRIYVAQSATGQNNGSSWQDAFTNLQNAITASQPGDEIWVAQGLYKPTNSTDRWATFAPKSGTKLFGGFAGNESNLDQRNWQANQVILNGDIGVEGDSADNCFNVMYLLEPDSFTTIDGFIFERGMAYPGTVSVASRERQYCGGGMYIGGQGAEAYPMIRNCIFRNNYARNFGGGVMVYGDNVLSSVAPKFENCRFEQNSSADNGGAYGRDACSAIERGSEFYQCYFIGNRAKTGAGILLEDLYGKDTIDIRKCSFIKNYAESEAGALILTTIRTGGLWINLDSCSFIRNTAPNYSAFKVSFNELDTETRAFMIRGCEFRHNTTTTESSKTIEFTALGNEQSKSIFIGNILEDSIAKSRLITLNNGYSVLEFLKNSILHRNHILSAGDFIYINFKNNHLKNIDGSLSPIMFNLSTLCDIENSVFISDFSNENISSISKTMFLSGKASFRNNTIISKIPLRFYSGGWVPETAILENCLIEVPYLKSVYQYTTINYQYNYCFPDSSWLNNPDLIFGPGNQFNVNPLFVNPDSNDYHLQPCSPLINAGTNTVIQPGDTDLDGNARIRGGTVDIGPYESAPLGLAAAPQTTGSCPGGSNGSVAFATDAACEPVIYNWSGPGGTSGAALEELAAGNYTITIMDAKNDTLMATFSIPEGTSPQVVAQTTPVICGTTTGGTAMLDGANGTAPFSFDWGNGIMDSMQTGLAYGVYPVTITDANGCTATANIQIARMGNLQVQIIKNDISCHDETDGSITIKPTNGAPPYEWLWQFNGSTEPDISDLPTGNYAGTMTDNLGCAINWIVPIENPDTIAANTEVTAATGPAVADGSILLVPSGGTGDFTVVWDNGANGVFINNLLPGFYTATITDDNGCTQTVTVEVPWSSGTGEVKVGQVRVWPNPVNNWLSVEPQLIRAPFTFTLTDANGRTVRNIHRDVPGAFLVPVGDLPEGVYGWEINDGGLRIGGKLIHQSK